MKKKILILVTNTKSYPDGTPTGLWLGELVHFYNHFDQNKFSLDIVSPNGGDIPVDPESYGFLVYDKETKEFKENPEKMALLNNTKSIHDVNPNDYEAIYFTGGHGTMFDFVGNQELNEFTANMYGNKKVVSSVCHGICGLLDVKLPNGQYMIKDKDITGYSWFEELLANRRNKVPFNAEAEVSNKGAKYKKAFLPFTSYCQQDENIITGQNPQSAKQVAKMVLEALK